ncbi:MAG: acetyl-CoA carboxylase biotin carboxylase subunit, partial [Bacteroidota bacterium]
AQTREEAIATMERALSEFVVEGVKTTIPFHQKMLKDPNFLSGNFNTQYLNHWKMS